VNEQLERSGVNARIDHRSLKEQGIDRMPTVHLGVHANEMEKRGIVTLKGDLNRQVVKINATIEAVGSAIEKRVAAIKRAVANPTEARDALLENLSKNGSVLQSALDRKATDQAQERNDKQQKRRQRRRSLV